MIGEERMIESFLIDFERTVVGMKLTSNQCILSRNHVERAKLRLVFENQSLITHEYFALFQTSSLLLYRVQGQFF
jgi:hypothetical protein